MNTAFNTVRVGLFFLLGLTLIGVTYEMLSEGRLFREDVYELIGRFEDVQTLRAGDEVRMAGVRIGRVGETRLEEGKALAVLEIQPQVQIAKDSVATIAMAGVLGGQYISIEAGNFTKGVLQHSNEIATRPTTDLNEIIERLAQAGDRLENVFVQVSQSIEENRDALRHTVANIETVSQKIVQGEGTLGRLIADDTAYKEIQHLTTNLREVSDKLAAGEGTLGRLIADDTAYKELQRITTNLGEISDKLAAGEGTLGRLLTDETLHHDIQAIIEKAERTIDGLGEQGPITAVGIGASALF
jgi:phospholipid/cholesterol/gamma-HCH transport system substrate-binding protein